MNQGLQILAVGCLLTGAVAASLAAQRLRLPALLLFLAIGMAAGALNPAAFHSGTAAADASDRIIYDSATGKIFYDSDGTGAAAAIQFAKVTAGLVLTQADFIVF